MRKIVTSVLLVMLVFSGVQVASAHGDTAPTNENKMPGAKHHQMKMDMMKQFGAEFKQMHQVKEQMWSLKEKVAEKQDEVLEKVLAAKNGKQDLAKVQTLHKKLKVIKKETKTLCDEKKEHFKEFHETLKKGDTQAARKHLQEAIGVEKSLVKKYEEQVSLLDQMLAATK